MAQAALSIDTTLMKNTGMSQKQMEALMSSLSSGGKVIRDHLTKQSFENADQLLEFLAQLLGMEYLKEIPVNDIPVDLVRHIPINYAKQHDLLPFKEDAQSIRILTANPLNLKALEDMRSLFQKPVIAILISSHRVQDAINRVYEKSSSSLQGLDDLEGEDIDLEDAVIDLLEAGDDEAPVIKLVNSLLFRAVKEKASDIHIEPYEREMAVRFRIDGVLYDVFKPSKKLQNSITSRLKVMANLNIAEKRLPQDGRIPIKLGGKDIDIRFNTVPTSFGERIVMRLQDRSNTVLELEQLGFSQRNLKQIRDLLTRTYGIILVTGPTGSGKSTTLYASLMELNTVDRNIITVENPVEQRISGIGQIQTNEKIGLTFASALRAILRQDPNIIMIGEIRDLETAEIAINASLTGHLVLSTIHTNDASGAFPRLLDMGCEPFLIATSLLGVAAQRLIRVLCPHCKEKHRPTDFELETLGISRALSDKGNICKPVGCSQCNQKGYYGRTQIQELLILTDEIRSLIMQNKDGATIKKKALEQGMVPLRDHGIQKILSGITSIEEILANTQMDL